MENEDSREDSREDNGEDNGDGSGLEDNGDDRLCEKGTVKTMGTVSKNRIKDVCDSAHPRA